MRVHQFLQVHGATDGSSYCWRCGLPGPGSPIHAPQAICREDSVEESMARIAEAVEKYVEVMIAPKYSIEGP